MEKIISIMILEHGKGLTELVFDFIIPGVSKFNSVEVFGESNRVRMNRWYTENGEECEQQLNFSELKEPQQKEMYNIINKQLKK